MSLPPELLQFLGSLVAILALAGLAYALRLGGKPKVTGMEAARSLANEAVDGFVAETIALDEQGNGAIMRDAQGRILLLKPHGNKFAGRILTTRVSARISDGQLVIDSGERRFGSSKLDLADSQTWADAINQLRQQNDA